MPFTIQLFVSIQCCSMNSLSLFCTPVYYVYLRACFEETQETESVTEMAQDITLDTIVILNQIRGFLVVQQLRLDTPKEGGPDSIPDPRTRFPMPQRYLAGLSEGRSGAAKYKKKKKTMFNKNKTKENAGYGCCTDLHLSFPY